jgi:hypothetical protein
MEAITMSRNSNPKLEFHSASDVKTITQALAAPFDLADIRFKPQVVKGNRALALAYVDARAIQDRLDSVLGVEGWQDEYTTLPDGSVVCRLRLHLGDDWITKMDVGSPSDQPDGGDRLKAAFSDALKRAAVKFGVGRYLYRLPSIWCEYDPVKKQFTQTPTLPEFARPKGQRAPASATKAAPVSRTDTGTTAAKAHHAPPANGRELLERLQAYDAKLAAEGLCVKGALLRHIAAAGKKAGFATDLSTWAAPAIALAVEQTKAFESDLPRLSPAQKTAG